MTIILASNSPRRRELLARNQIDYVAIPSTVDEPDPQMGEDPRHYVVELALAKARDVAARFPDRVVLGADTTVAIGNASLAKPSDAADAVRMLRLLRGRTHRVVTGVAVMYGTEEYSGFIAADVLMRDYSDDEIAAYVRTGEPMDKAGSYAVQESGGTLVDQVIGCYTTVVGLPMCLTIELLQRCGVSPLPDAESACPHTVHSIHPR